MAKGNGTAVAAFFAMAFGAWLIDSGVQGRHPIKALEDVIRNPSNAKTTLAADKGSFTPVATLIGADGTASASSSSSNAGNNSAGIPTPSAPRNASVKEEQAYAKSQFAKYGWDGSQMNALIDLWNQESGWNPHADNPSSGAYGIPQALPATKMSTAGSDWQTNWKTQINWGLKYIKDRYGSPVAAEQHELANHWY